MNMMQQAMRAMQMPSDDKPIAIDPALHDALQKRLREVVDRPLTPRSLLELGQLARTTADLLIIGADPRALMHKRGFGPGMMGGLQPALGNYSEIDEIGTQIMGQSAGAYYPGPPLAGAPGVETFGSSIVREGIAAISSMSASFGKRKVDAEATMNALVIAKEKGYTAIAAKLEKDLLGEDDAPPAPARPIDLATASDLTCCGGDGAGGHRPGCVNGCQVCGRDGAAHAEGCPLSGAHEPVAPPPGSAENPLEGEPV